MEADKAKEEAKYNSQSVTVITKEDIARKQGKSVEDVIFNEVGVTRTVDAMGKVGISIRGADPRHTLIMVDGQPVLGDVSKYSGNGDELMRIGAENIERIEIIRGAASAKYGADAIGGVVNVITKVPKDSMGIQFNAEGRYHTSRYYSGNESSALPSNFFLRADSGKVGKFKAAAWTSKRYVMPVYASAKDKVFGPDVIIHAGNLTFNGNWYEKFKPSLRYYGDVRNSGVSGEFAFNDDHRVSFRMQTEQENMERRNKNAYYPLGSFMEPMQLFKRNIKRDTYNITYNGRGGKTDWKLDVNYGKSRENDVSIYNEIGGSGQTKYSGFSQLGGLDWLEHTQTTVNLSMNTAANDQHFLSYGVGYTKEEGEGTRIKNASRTRIQTINPWDYDKSLQVRTNTASETDEPVSYVHNYDLTIPKDLAHSDQSVTWNKNAEYYGGNDKIPPFTYDDAMKLYSDKSLHNLSDAERTELNNKLSPFRTALLTYAIANHISLKSMGDSVYEFYGIGVEKNELLKWDGEKFSADGQYFGEEFDKRQNQVVVGKAELKKTYAYVQDNWQITKNTMVTPSLRIDHSDLFGSQVTGNMGLLHNLNGNPHRRFKANVGTGYAEPGMGELYYNWEMFGGSIGSPGWYWMGNPDLKPEKSLNFDISLEGESNKTFAKVSLFHNEIKDYMTSYFTGQLIDFAWGPNAFNMTPDRIYSFRNLGKAKITGFEAEVQQKFNDNWSGKLGYTYLYALNDSDSDMPRRLLDRPKHKFDVSLNYKNNRGDFRGAFWGSFYDSMLDSNSVSTSSLYQKDDNDNYIRNKNVKYTEKSFGIWNLLFEKDFGKDLTAYVGVDNIFDHRDDDRAFQDRVYRFGINMKVEDLGKALSQPFHIRKDKDGNPIITNLYGDDWFLSRPVDPKEQESRKSGDVRFFGDYRVRSNMFKGDSRVPMRMTRDTAANDEAARNFADNPDHGLEQRLRIGVDYQIADGLNLQVVGSTAKRDTSYNVADKRGLHDPYLEQAELTKSTKKWDWSVGRISEPMGVTGYWFGKEYDGARVVYTDQKTQVSVGYGDFSQATGITDSAYNHKEAVPFIYRAPSYQELLGLLAYSGTSFGGNVGEIYMDPDHLFNPAENTNYREKFNKAGWIQDKKGNWIAPGQPGNATSPEDVARAKIAVLQELVGICEKVNGKMWEDALSSEYIMKTYNDPKFNIKVKLQNGTIIDMSNKDYKEQAIWGMKINPNPKAIGDSSNDKYGGLAGLLNEGTIKKYANDYLNNIKNTEKGEGATFETLDGKELTQEEAINQMFVDYVGGDAAYLKPNSTWYDEKAIVNGNWNAPGNLNQLVYDLSCNYFPYSDGANAYSRQPIPLPGAPETYIVPNAYVLKQDVIPAMDRAAYIKVRRQLRDNVGVEAWKLNSFGEGAKDSHGLQDMQIADVLGIGTQIRLGKRSMLSFDYGQNRSDMGKFFHGGRDIYGDYSGGGHTPDFWVARLDIGIADTDMPGSWHAYLDYKAFDHGSFVGGTGADLPDRYLDGIRSFTTGIGYVPARNLLLEASYTFGAKSTQMRDTLYTPENFTLGDYTRVQMTYKF